jgi:hypothetical protein
MLNLTKSTMELTIYVMAGIIIGLFVLTILSLILKNKSKKKLIEAVEKRKQQQEHYKAEKIKYLDEIEQLKNRVEVSERAKKQQRTHEQIVFDTLDVLIKRQQMGQ